MEQEVWQDGTGTYLKITGEGRETVADRMFLHQNITGFLPVEIRRINGVKEYHYNISGKVAFSQYITENRMTKDSLQKLLLQLIRQSDLLQEYLLDADGVIWHEDFLFVDRRTGDLGLIYQEGNVRKGMDAFAKLVEFIIEKMNTKDEELTFFVYELHKRAREAGTTRQMLLEYIESRTAGLQRQEERVAEPVPEPGESRKSSCAWKKNRMAYALPAAVMVMGIGITVFAWVFGWFRQGGSGEWQMSTGVGVSLFFMAVSGYGAWKLLPEERDNTINWKGGDRPKKVCLVSCQGKMESIPVGHYPFTLGAEKDRVDGVIPASGIARIHAQLLWEENKLFVLDEETEQGTFCNHERLVPWQKKCLRDGDILRLANTEYVVEISSLEILYEQETSFGKRSFLPD